MTQTIDVTGLSPEAIRQVQQLVDTYRELTPTPPPAEGPKPFWTGPVPAQGTPEWADWLYAWAASHPKREGPVEIDDDRGSIYDRDTADC
jgi:hypothetical protein